MNTYVNDFEEKFAGSEDGKWDLEKRRQSHMMYENDEYWKHQHEFLN